jgi:hypothetical protein
MKKSLLFAGGAKLEANNTKENLILSLLPQLKSCLLE